MADSSHNDSSDATQELNGHAAQHEDLFQDVGKKVEGMSLGDSGDKESNEDRDDGPKLVDEIESYCMNCGENVCFATAPPSSLAFLIRFGLGYNASTVNQDPVLPRDYSDVVPLPTLPLEEFRNPVSRRNPGAWLQIHP